MQPLEFDPILKRIRWGGRRLGTALGKPIGAHSDYAESWEIADHGAEQSTVADGPLRGWTLARLVAEQGPALLGARRRYDRFPLLVKFLDANDRLSVQVHPDDAHARQMGLGANGKTEAWIVLDALPGSRIYCGLEPGVDRRQLEQRLDAGTLEECLHAYSVRQGDCIFVPAGTVHAIGEGILLAEIQQTSDVTFRLYDWGRVDSAGKLRPLHRAEAIACIDFARGPVDPVVPRPVAGLPGLTEELVRCEYFVLRRHTFSQPLSLPEPLSFPEEDRFRLILPLAGEVDVHTGDYRKRLRLGATLLIPASGTHVVLSPDGEATVLEVFPP
jgi:mannose-6-phosphate isomerase